MRLKKIPGYCPPVELEVTPRSACSLRVILCCRLLTRLKSSFYLSRCYHELRALSGWHIGSQFFRAQLSCSRVCSLELAFLQSPSVHGQRLCSGPAGECVHAPSAVRCRATGSLGDGRGGDSLGTTSLLSRTGGFLFIKFHSRVGKILSST